MSNSLLRKSLHGSWNGPAHYDSPPINGKTWAFCATLENGSLAYILADLGIPEAYRCPIKSASDIRMLPGTLVELEIVDWDNLQVIVKLEAVSEEKLRICNTCRNLDQFIHADFSSNDSIIAFALKLKDLVTKGVVSEFEPDDSNLAKSRVRLNQFSFGQSLPVNKSHEARVFIICNECQAEWQLGYNFERSAPCWFKHRQGFRF